MGDALERAVKTSGADWYPQTKYVGRGHKPRPAELEELVVWIEHGGSTMDFSKQTGWPYHAIVTGGVMAKSPEDGGGWKYPQLAARYRQAQHALGRTPGKKPSIMRARERERIMCFLVYYEETCKKDWSWNKSGEEHPEAILKLSTVDRMGSRTDETYANAEVWVVYEEVRARQVAKLEERMMEMATLPQGDHKPLGDTKAAQWMLERSGGERWAKVSQTRVQEVRMDASGKVREAIDSRMTRIEQG